MQLLLTVVVLVFNSYLYLDAGRVTPIRGSVRCFWPFIDIIGCDSAIQASLIAFALHGDSNRTRLNPKLEKLSFLCKDSANRVHKVKLA